jgi:mycofactocin system transcriptional regulator
MKQFPPEVVGGPLRQGLAELHSSGSGVEAVHVVHDLGRPVHPLLRHDELQRGVAVEDTPEDHHPDASPGPPGGFHHVHRLGAVTPVRIVLPTSPVGVERQAGLGTRRPQGLPDGIVEHREVTAGRREVDTLEAGLRRPLHLSYACVGIRDGDVGDPRVPFRCLRHEVGEPPVVHAHADRLERVVPGVTPRDQTSGGERYGLTVQATVVDDGRSDTGSVHVDDPSGVILEAGAEARLEAALDEARVDLIGVTDAGRLREPLDLCRVEPLPERPALLLARGRGFARPPGQQALTLHLLGEAAEALAMRSRAVRSELVHHRRSDVAVDRHDDVPIVPFVPAPVAGISVHRSHPLRSRGRHSTPDVALSATATSREVDRDGGPHQVVEPSIVARPTDAAANPQMITSTLAIEQAALRVFEEHGFEATTVEDIAAAAGISRRTFFRYFASKNDILFAGFDDLLADLDEWLAASDPELPMLGAIAEATIRFNRVHSDGEVAHRERMELILHTPALRAHASLRHAQWGATIARFAALRLGVGEDSLAAQVVGHASLGAANAAYERWLIDPSADLGRLIAEAFTITESLADLGRPQRPVRRRR